MKGKISNKLLKLPVKNVATQYIRRSSGKQEASLEQQMDVNNDYIERKGYKRATGEQSSFVETVSAKTFTERKELMKIIELVESGRNKFNCIIIYKPNRYGRGKDIEEFFFYEWKLKKHNVRIEYALEEACNLPGMPGFIMRGVNYMEAAQYIQNLSKDTCRGVLWHAEHGYSTGGDACFGYKRMLVDLDGNQLGILEPGMAKSASKQTKVIYVLDKPDVVSWIKENIFKLPYLKEWSPSRTAHNLNDLLKRGEGYLPPRAGRILNRRDGTIVKFSDKWQSSTILDMWKNTSYIGWRHVVISADNEFRGHEAINKIAHEPLIDEYTFWSLYNRYKIEPQRIRKLKPKIKKNF